MLTLEQWKKLSDEDKKNRYNELTPEDMAMERMTCVEVGTTIDEKIELSEKQKKESKEFERAVMTGNIDKWFNNQKY